MNRVPLLFCVSLLGADRDALISDAATAMKPKLIETRRDFHQHPELSNREVRTGKIVAERLRALGLDEVKTGIAGNGVVGILKGKLPGPTVAWRSDMDALPINETMDIPYRSQNPGVKHACGHDGHMAVALGTAEVLSKMRDQIRGTVKFIFQPAEEGPPPGEEGGAPLMVRQGVLENVKAIFGLHMSMGGRAGTAGYTSGPSQASSDTYEIVLKGKRSHGANPHEGIDAIAMAAQCYQGLQLIKSRRIDAQQPMVLTIGKIAGGDRHNVLAQEVRMDGTLRTFSEKTREEVRTMMRQTLTNCTGMLGGSYELNFIGVGNPPVVNDPPLVARTIPSLERILGKDKVIASPPAMVSEDFSYYQLKIPGFFWWLGIANPERGITGGLHTADMDMDEEALVYGVRAASGLLLDYLDNQR
jgi:amidohydrolase